MTVLNIHNKNDTKEIEELNKLLNEKNIHIFLFIFMDGCGYCDDAKPELKKLENMKNYKDSDNLVISDINESLLDSINNSSVKENIRGFPTFRHFTNGTYENYEDSKDLTNTDNKVSSFSEWIYKKTKNLHMKGGQKKRETKKRKWSLKYKKSINCKKPKGFSQRQHCKYGRRKFYSKRK